MVLPNGSVYWIEPQHTAFRKAPAGAFRIQDDTFFRAAVVSAGAMGIVVELVLIAQDLMYMEETRVLGRMLDGSRNQVYNKLRTQVEQFRHVEVLLNPYPESEVRCF